MFFGNSTGLNSFFPDNITDNYKLPEIVFTNLQVLNQQVKINQKLNGKIILWKSLLFTDEITLNYTHKSFSIEFAALHYLNPKANKYRYQLEGFDNDLIETDASMRLATYSNLSPGRYIFKVFASNGDGIWNSKPAELKINVLPPWWATVWAFMVYCLILIALFYLIYHFMVIRERFKNQIRYEKMKARKIEELDQMKIRFFTNVSHELRTPLSLLIDPLQKLKSGKIPPSNVNYYYSLMYRNARRLMKLVNQLLDFRRIQDKKITLETSQGDMVAYIGNVADAFRIKALHRRIEYTYRADPPTLIARFDPDKIEKILFNLLSNAFKYTPENGEIRLELKIYDHPEKKAENEKLLELKVSDNGIGIPPESIDKVFNYFYQAKLPDGYQAKGTGIGLALTKELVELQKGEISVASEVNKGTTFTVLLPFEDIGQQNIPEKEIFTEDETREEEGIDVQPDLFNDNVGVTTENEGKLLILIVEDNADVRTYLRTELSVTYRIMEAINGVEGLRKAVDEVPDLIISDIMMPGMDGLELCRRIKTDERTSHIPVVLLTARKAEKAVVAGFELGADAYIKKPFSTAVLIARIKNLVESRKKLSETVGKSPFIDIKRLAGNSSDESFLNKVVEIIEGNISEPEFNIDTLAGNLQLLRRQLTRKIKALTGQTVHEFVKTVRLNKAAELLLTTDDNVSEIAFKLGYTIPANFSRSFTRQFGKSPTDYVASIIEEK